MDSISYPSYTYFTGRQHQVQQLSALKLLDAKNNASIGLAAGENIENGTNNVFVGTRAGANAIADSSVFVGTLTGSESKSIRGSCFVGYRAGQYANYINQSVCLGPYSGQSMIRAVDNVLIGYQAGANLTSGSRNVTIGSYSAFSQYNASDNVVIGHNAGYQNQLGSNNCFVGSSSGFTAYDCIENVCLGVSSGEGLYSGIKNVLCGYRAGANIRDASNCIAIGTSAMEFFWDGDTNTCLGTEVARRFTGTNNTIIGGYSTSNGSGDFNTIVGSRSMNRQTLEQVNLSNCVIIGENIQFDIPVKPVSVGIDAFDTIPDAQRGNESPVVIFQDANGTYNNTTAFLLINVVPVGDPVLIKERYFAMGTPEFPMVLNTGTEGSYTFRWGSGVDEFNNLLATVPIQFDVAIDASGAIDAFLTVYGVEERVWSRSPQSTTRVCLQQSFDPPSIRVILDDADETFSPDLPGVSYACDSLSIKKDEGLELGLRNPPSTNPFVPGMEIQIIESAVPALNKVWNLVSYDASTGTVIIDAPLSGGDIGSGAILILSKVIQSPSVQSTVANNRPRVTVPSFASMLIRRKQFKKIYIDGSGDLAEGTYDVDIVKTDTFDIQVASSSSVNTGVMSLGSFEPLVVGLDVTTVGTSKSIDFLEVTYNQRADSELERTVFDGPFPFDGHVHIGAGTEDDMNQSIRSNIITFTDEGYAAAQYDIGALSSNVTTTCIFELTDNVNFGVAWLDSFEITCRTQDTWFRTDVTYTLGSDNKTLASVSNDTVQVEGDIKTYTLQRATTADDFEFTESQLPLSIGSPGITDRVEIRVYHDIKKKTLDVQIVIYTDLKILALFMTFLQTPSVNRFARNLAFFADGFMQLFKVTYQNDSYTLFPTFKDCIFLGSNFTVGGDEAEEERSNVCIASIGTQRLFRGRLDEFRMYSNVVVMNTATLTGNVDSSTPTLTIQPTNINQSLDVVGHSVFDSVDLRDQLYIASNIVCDGNVYIGQDTRMDGTANIGQDLVVGQDATVRGNAIFEKDVIVYQNMTIDLESTVIGNAAFLSNVFVEDLLTANSDLVVAGNVEARQNMDILGNVFIYHNASVVGDLDVTGNTDVAGNVSVTEWVFVTGGITTEIDVYIKGISVADYLESLDIRVTVNEDDIVLLRGNVTQLQGRMDAAEDRLDDIIDSEGNGYIPDIWVDIADLQLQTDYLLGNDGEIWKINANITTNQLDIANLDLDMEYLIGDDGEIWNIIANVADNQRDIANLDLDMDFLIGADGEIWKIDANIADNQRDIANLELDMDFLIGDDGEFWKVISNVTNNQLDLDYLLGTDGEVWKINANIINNQLDIANLELDMDFLIGDDGEFWKVSSNVSKNQLDLDYLLGDDGEFWKVAGNVSLNQDSITALNLDMDFLIGNDGEFWKLSSNVTNNQLDLDYLIGADGEVYKITGNVSLNQDLITALDLDIADIYDNQIPTLQSAIDGKVNKSGDTMQGTLTTQALNVNGDLQVSPGRLFVNFGDTASLDGFIPTVTNSGRLGVNSGYHTLRNIIERIQYCESSIVDLYNKYYSVA